MLKQGKFYMCFVDLEKTFDSTKKVLEWSIGIKE